MTLLGASPPTTFVTLLARLVWFCSRQRSPTHSFSMSDQKTSGVRAPQKLLYNVGPLFAYIGEINYSWLIRYSDINLWHGRFWIDHQMLLYTLVFYVNSYIFSIPLFFVLSSFWVLLLCNIVSVFLALCQVNIDQQYFSVCFLLWFWEHVNKLIVERKYKKGSKMKWK